MTAGIAATSPRAVAKSDSAMPGATTARLVFLDAAIAWKLFMMPQTVPKRPMKGEVDPTVARNGMKRSSRSISRFTVTCMTRSMRSWRLVRSAGAAAPFAHRRGEDGGHGIERPRADAVVEIVERAARPEALLEMLGIALQTPELHDLVEDHRPRPERRCQQEEH